MTGFGRRSPQRGRAPRMATGLETLPAALLEPLADNPLQSASMPLLLHVRQSDSWHWRGCQYPAPAEALERQIVGWVQSLPRGGRVSYERARVAGVVWWRGAWITVGPCDCPKGGGRG